MMMMKEKEETERENRRLSAKEGGAAMASRGSLRQGCG